MSGSNLNNANVGNLLDPGFEKSSSLLINQNRQSVILQNGISIVNGVPGEEGKKEEDGGNNVGADDGRTSSAKISASDQTANRKPTDEKSGILVEKAQGLAEINERTKSSKENNPLEFITKEELDKNLDQFPIPENHFEVERICLSMSAQEFFN